MKKYISILVIPFLFFACNKSSKTKEYILQSIGWKINIPDKFTVLDSTKMAAINKKAMDSANRKYNTNIDFPYKTLINIIDTKNKQFNNLTVTIAPYKHGKEYLQEDSTKSIKPPFDLLKSEFPSSKIDSTSKEEFIDGLSFQVFKISFTYPNKTVLNTTTYGKFYKGYYLAIGLNYTDPKVGSELKEILNSSKFIK